MKFHSLLFVGLLLSTPVLAQQENGYQLPPKVLQDIAMAPLTPQVVFNEACNYMVSYPLEGKEGSSPPHRHHLQQLPRVQHPQQSCRCVVTANQEPGGTPEDLYGCPASFPHHDSGEMKTPSC